MSNFKNIIGHEQIIQHMSTALKSKKISHAYIFEGPNDSGKNLLAKAFANQFPWDAYSPCSAIKSSQRPLSSAIF